MWDDAADLVLNEGEAAGIVQLVDSEKFGRQNADLCADDAPSDLQTQRYRPQTQGAGAGRRRLTRRQDHQTARAYTRPGSTGWADTSRSRSRILSRLQQVPINPRSQATGRDRRAAGQDQTSRTRLIKHGWRWAGRPHAARWGWDGSQATDGHRAPRRHGRGHALRGLARGRRRPVRRVLDRRQANTRVGPTTATRSWSTACSTCKRPGALQHCRSPTPTDSMVAPKPRPQSPSVPAPAQGHVAGQGHDQGGVDLPHLRDRISGVRLKPNPEVVQGDDRGGRAADGRHQADVDHPRSRAT